MTDSSVLESTRGLTDAEERAALLSTVADPIRLNLLFRLAAEGTQCVCNLQADPPIPGNLLSYHLRVLRDAGLVTGTRRGRWVDYTLSPGALERLHSALPTLTHREGHGTGCCAGGGPR